MQKFAIAAVLAIAGSASAVNYDAAYIIYDGGFGGAVFNHYNAVASVTGSIVQFYNPTGNFAASIAAGDTYNSVYVYDITATPMADPNDIAAIGAWWNNSKSVVIDGRSYGAYFNGGSGFHDEDIFAKNTANWFNKNRGGFYVGTDHHPDWTWNGNQALAAAGFNQNILIEGGPVTGFNASPLYAGVNPFGLDWSGIGWSVGHTSVGVQPNGVFLGTILFTGATDPVISVNLVPAPGALALFGLGAIVSRRRR